MGQGQALLLHPRDTEPGSSQSSTTSTEFCTAHVRIPNRKFVLMLFWTKLQQTALLGAFLPVPNGSLLILYLSDDDPSVSSRSLLHINQRI